MGGGKENKSKEDENGGTAGSGDNESPALVLETVGEYMKIPGTKTEITVMAKIRARVQPNEDRRAPITICAAIDRSSSMKDHLPLLKETLQFMMQQLRAEDMLSLVTFDHEVKVELPLTKMDATGKIKAEKAIHAVKERGHTNLSGGLLAALQALYHVPSSNASLVESVLLFTDGKANVGIRNQEGLVKATKSILSQIGRQACVFTFGFGSEHDADLLSAVADAGNGLFYYIDNSDSIPESFCDCLGGLLSVAAQNVRLTIKSCGDVCITRPLTAFKITEKEINKCYEVIIPDVYCEEEKCVLAKVMAPDVPDLSEPSTVSLFSCRVEYFDVLCTKPNVVEVECTVVRNASLLKPVPSDYVDEIELHKMRCEVVETLTQANSLAGVGNIQRARMLLDKANIRIRHSRVAAKPLARHLLNTVKESLGGLQDQVTYSEHGKAVLRNYADSHAKQRSNMSPSLESYTQQKAKKAATFSTAPPTMLGNPPVVHDISDVLSPYRNSSKESVISQCSSRSERPSKSEY